MILEIHEELVPISFFSAEVVDISEALTRRVRHVLIDGKRMPSCLADVFLLGFDVMTEQYLHEAVKLKNSAFFKYEVKL